MKKWQVDELLVYQMDSREEMGRVSGEAVIDAICAVLERKEEANVMFAAAPSQNDVLETVMTSERIDWSRVNGFHMDEYIGLSAAAPQGFGNFLRTAVFNKRAFHEVFYINPEAVDAQAEAERYEELLYQHPMDVCILGVGENGHLAFNDPEEARFDDTKLVRTVQLDDVCRQQQVNDGCFASIDEVPKVAMTVTIPGLLRAERMFCVVPTARKARAIAHMLEDRGISTSCPASVLRTKKGASLYLDSEAASLLAQKV